MTAQISLPLSPSCPELLQGKGESHCLRALSLLVVVGVGRQGEHLGHGADRGAGKTGRSRGEVEGISVVVSITNAGGDPCRVVDLQGQIDLSGPILKPLKL